VTRAAWWSSEVCASAVTVAGSSGKQIQRSAALGGSGSPPHARACHGAGWDGMGWDGMGWDGMGWDGMGWDGMGWDGMGWDGIRWDGMGSGGIVRRAERMCVRVRTAVC
jgi:pentapeptide MXKDX repeat protein